jgi:hypothetical protein
MVDYKGAAGPYIGHTKADYCQQHDWQIQMYAWLRGRKADAKPVVAGIVLYINELLPSRSDVVGLREQIRNKKTDIVPARGSQDYYVLTTAPAGSAPGPALTEAFRIQRALRVIPVTPASIAVAGTEFDQVVVDIESRIHREIAVGDVSQAWVPTCQDPDTCVACDSRYYCPKPYGKDDTYVIAPPPTP